MHETETEPQPWTLVVAMAQNGVIGRDNSLPWRLKGDLQRFKRLTMGHCLLMGRKTYDSIGRPLPGRQTIVLSRQTDNVAAGMAAGVAVAASLEQVSDLVEAGREVMVVGGAQVYQLVLPRCQRMLITRVTAEIDGDTFFPQVDWTEWTLVSSESFPADADNQWPCELQIWERRTGEQRTGEQHNEVAS